MSGFDCSLPAGDGPMQIQHGEQAVVHAADGPFDPQGHVFQRRRRSSRPNQQTPTLPITTSQNPTANTRRNVVAKGISKSTATRGTQPADRQQGDQRAADQQRMAAQLRLARWMSW